MPFPGGLTINQALTAKIGADLSGLRRGMSQARRITQTAGQGMRNAMRIVTRSVVALTAAVTVLGVVAVKTFAQFSREMTKIETLVGLSAERVAGMGQEILKLAPAVGRAPVELSRALFAITSGGERGAGAMQLLTQSARAAAAGLGDTAAIARTATAAMQAFGIDAVRAVDVMVAIVREGNLVAEDLAGALGKAMGAAATMGVSFEEMGAFVATFTRLGVDAQLATTSLRAALMAIQKPGQEAEEALAAMGMTAFQLRAAIGREGLTKTLIDLIQRAERFNVNIAALIPNTRALAGVLGTAGVQGTQYRQILDSIIHSQGLTNKAFERTQKELGFVADQIKADLTVALIQLGEVLAPVAKNIADKVNEGLDTLRGAIEAGKPVLLELFESLGVLMGQKLAIGLARGMGEIRVALRNKLLPPILEDIVNFLDPLTRLWDAALNRLEEAIAETEARFTAAVAAAQAAAGGAGAPARATVQIGEVTGGRLALPTPRGETPRLTTETRGLVPVAARTVTPADEAQRILEELRGGVKKTNTAFEGLENVIANQFTGAITGAIFGLNSFTNALRQAALSVAQQFLGGLIRTGLGALFGGPGGTAAGAGSGFFDLALTAQNPQFVRAVHEANRQIAFGGG